MREARRPRHQAILRLLDALDDRFLESHQCHFGGGTRIALDLDEYRESLDVDFLCADISGYREMRAGVRETSLGPILRDGVAGIDLQRDVRADQYGIRTVVGVGGVPVKFEIILEARISLGAARSNHFPVSMLDRETCFAEKWLANADRWNDSAVLRRDLIDLAFMLAHWPEAEALAGAARAAGAYGGAIRRTAVAATARFAENASLRRQCIDELGIEDSRTLMTGIRRLQRLGGRLPLS